MRIVFMGTPEFSVAPLERLHQAGHKIVAVYTQPPRAAGRGQHLTPSAVQHYAEQHGMPVYTPVSLKSDEAQKELAALKPDLMIVVAYGLLLPKAVLDICPCVNIHASLLPRWRGAAPIQRAILAGDEVSGVTIMQMDEGLDTGDVILKESISIKGMNTQKLHDSLSELGAKMILQAVEAYGSWKVVPQEGEATYAHKISKSEAEIDWKLSAEYIVQQINAFNPWPGAYTNYQGQKIKILDARAVKSDCIGGPGEVVDESLSILCGEGLLKPLIVQRQGKKAMSIEEFLRGNVVPKGDIFG